MSVPAAASLKTPPALPGPRLAAAPEVLQRLVSALLAEELGRLRGRPIALAEALGWGNETRLDADGLGLDSLALLEVVARFTRQFDLAETGVEDYFFVRPTLGDWTELFAHHLRSAREPAVLFRTSGSSGPPKEVRHSLTTLADEVDALIPALPHTRVIAVVPPQHLYGFLFTVLMPALTEAPVLDARAQGPGTLLKGLASGDLVVATPFQWSALLHAGNSPVTGVTGLSSGAPTDLALWQAAEAAGLDKMTEIYGATETAGVGRRTSGDAPFELLDHLARQDAQIVRQADPAIALPVQDRLTWVDTRTFRVAGRLDGAVQVGGVNVYPETVARHLGALAEVAEVAVRPETTGNRLKAFVVPADPAGAPEELEAALRTQAASLDPPARPARYRFGPALPRTDTGKLTDWPD